MKKQSAKFSFLLATGVFCFFLFIFFITEKRGTGYLISKVLYSLFLAIFTFLIFYTGKISHYRSLFFIISAISFIIFYKFKLWGITGNFFIAPQKNVPEVPVCHIALASNFFITFLDQLKAIFVYGWDKWGFYTIGVFYIFSTLAIGQGFCSWVCFYGGIDEFFSKIFKKRAIKLDSVPGNVRDFPLGFLLFLLLSSIILFEPIFCLWFCPLKMTTAFLNNGETLTYKIQIIIFVLIGIIFLVLLPLLTKKRAFCSFICPFGAFISVAGRVNPYRLEIENEECKKCGKCISVCPSLAIKDNYEITNYCTKCFKCVDECPENAIKLKLIKNNSDSLFIFFILSAIIFGGTISSFFIPEVFYLLLNLIKV